MRMLRYVLAVLALCLLSVSAQATNCAVANGACFWIGGTGTMDFATDSAHWSNSSGGSTCSCEPISSNSLTFDGSSGGGTITANATVNTTTFTFGAFTGTLDFSVHNNNVNIVNSGGTSLFSGTGTGTRTLNMGTGTWTIGSNTASSSASINFLTTTNFTLTPSPALAPIVIVGGGGSSNQLYFGAKSWGALTITGSATYPSAEFQIESGNSANDTFASLTINAPVYILFRSAQTFTFTGGITVNGASWSAPIYLGSDGVQPASSNTTLASGAAASFGYAVLRNVTGATSTITVNPAVNLGSNGGTLSLTSPGTGGGGGYIIGQ